jgi:hypothetical protein
MRYHSLFFASVLFVLPISAFQKTTCNAIIVQGLQNGSIKPDDDIFRRDGQTIMSNTSNIELTVPGCEAKCGSNFDWYTDVGPRLSTWLIPVVLLIGNFCFAPLGKPSSLLAIIHLLGDPIDSLWSLLTKLEVWNRCWDLAEQLSRNQGRDKNHVRDRGTILVAIQELEGPSSDPRTMYQQIIHNSTIDGDDPSRPRLHHLCREIANEISDSSTNELPRTWLAILSYVWTVLGAFVDAIGGTSSSQPGGRIGTAMFLSWLVPALLLSNTVGSFTSRRTIVRILERFARDTHPHLPAQQRRSVDRRVSAEYLDLQVFSQDRVSHWSGNHKKAWTSFDTAQVWFGGVYTYLPAKNLFTVAGHEEKGRRPVTLLIVSVLPLLIATVTAFMIIWLTPTVGFTCRHVPLLSMFGIWIISAAIGRWTWKTVATGKYHWYFMLAKDSIISSASLIMVFLQSAGIFNSCFCWGSVYSLGPRAYVQLDADRDRKRNAKTVYPALVWTCLGLQTMIFMLALRMSRRGRMMMRRSEKTKRDDFWNIHRGNDVRPEMQSAWNMWGGNRGDMEMDRIEAAPLFGR